MAILYPPPPSTPMVITRGIPCISSYLTANICWIKHIKLKKKKKWLIWNYHGYKIYNSLLLKCDYVLVSINIGFKPSQKSYETISVQSLRNEKPREIWTPNLTSIPILKSLNVIFMSSIDTACILLKEDEKKSPKMKAFDSIGHTFFCPRKAFLD